MHPIKRFFAKQYLTKSPSQKFIGVGGSVGKSLTIELLQQLIKEHYSLIATTGQSDSKNDVLEAIWKGRKSNQKVVVEIKPKSETDMDFYTSKFRPSLLILTNLGSDAPLVGFYKKLIQNLNLTDGLIVNHDDPTLLAIMKELDLHPTYYGTTEEECHVWASRIRIDHFHTVYELNYGVERVEVDTPLLGSHLVMNQLAAAAFALTNGIPLTSIKKVFEATDGLAGHMEVSGGISGSVIIDDSAEISKESMDKALETLNLVSAKRRILVVGGLPAGTEDQKNLIRKIYKDNLDYVFLVGKDIKEMGDELLKFGYPAEKLESNLHNPQIVGQLLKILSKGDVVLIKGDPSLGLGEIAARLVKSH